MFTHQYVCLTTSHSHAEPFTAKALVRFHEVFSVQPIIQCVLIVLQLVLVVASEATFFQGETTYKYEATVTNVVENPTPFTSQYEIVGMVYVRRHGDTSVFALRDVKLSQHIGKQSEDNIIYNNNNATYEQGNIELPIEVHYLENGTIDYLNVDNRDSTWSINLKKGIASLFQLDYTSIHNNRKEHDSSSFTSQEQTLMGQCSTTYHFFPQHEGNLKITKTYEDCVDKWIKHSSLISPGFCESPTDEFLKTNRYRIYSLQYEDNKYSIDNIESIWNVLFYPVNGKGGSHSVNVKQTIQKYSGTSYLSDLSIMDSTKVSLQNTNDIDLTTIIHGKTQKNSNCEINRVKDTLEVMIEYMKNGHVNLQEPDWKKTNSYYSLINSLRAINTECFHSLAVNLNNTSSAYYPDTYDLYMNVLPFIGTYSSTMFMHELVKHQQVDDSLAKTFYREMPFYIMFPDTRLLKELSDILLWDKNVNEHVMRSAILSFATILSKSDPTDAAPCIDKIIDAFNACQNYKCQMLYIGALQNTKSNKVAELLNPVITNKFRNESITPNLRNIAMWAALHEHIKDPKVVQGIYLPILTDAEESLELRVNALKILMIDTSMKNLLKLNNLMKSEKNEHLYNIFYTSLNSLSRSVTPCYKSSRQYARNILPYIKRTAHSSYESFSNVYDYYDKSYNMGAITKISVVGSFFNHRKISIYVQFSTHVSNIVADQYSLYIKLQANEHVKKTIISVLKTVDLVTIINLKNILSELEQMDPEQAKGFHVEMILLKSNKIIEARTYGSIQVFGEDLRNIVKNRDQETIYSIANGIEATTTITTDIGTPVIMYNNFPTIYKIKTFWNNEDKFDMKLELHGWNTQTYGIKTFSPINNKWYGSRRYLQVDSRLPIHFQSKIEEKGIEIKFDLQNDNFFGKGDIGFQSFVQSQVYIYDEVTETYEYYKPVTKGLKHQQEVNLWDIENEETGMIYNVTIFNCERNMSPSKLRDIKNYIKSNVNKNYGENYVIKYLLQARHLWAQVTLSADPGMCGFGIRGKRNSHQVTDITTTVKYDVLIASLGDENIAQGTSALYFTYDLKNENDIIKGWNTKALIELVGEMNIRNKVFIVSTRWNKEDYSILINQKIDGNKSLFNVDIKSQNDSDVTKIKLSTTSTLSREQKTAHDIEYPECKGYGNANKYACAVARLSLRHDECHIQYTNINEPLKTYLETFNDYMLTNYAHYYKKIPNEKKSKEGELDLKVDYNLASEDMNIIVNGPFTSFGYIGIPNKDNDLLQLLFTPTSSPIDSDALILNAFGMNFVCEVNRNYYVNQFNEHVQYNLTDDLTQFAILEFPSANISVRNLNQVMHVQFQVGDNVFEAYDDREALHIIYNGQELPTGIQEATSVSKDYLEYKIITNQKQKQLFVSAPIITGIVISYSRNQINIYSNRETSATGLCFE